MLGSDCQSIRLSVGASSSNGSSLSYQWLRNGTDIPGATQAELTLNTLTQDRNAQFSVRVSAGGASTTAGPIGLDANAIDGSQLRLGSIELGQVMLYPSGDSGVALIQDRDVLVKVNMLANSALSTCKPTGQLRIEDAQGQVLQSITLQPPSAAVPTSTPSVPSLATSYSATAPGALMKSGVRLAIAFSGVATATRLAPALISSPSITVVTIPIQIGSTEGAPPPGIDTYVRDRAPVAAVSLLSHAPIRSQSVTSQPSNRNDWGQALQNLLQEISDLYRLEGSPPRQHYYGVVRQSIAGNFAGQGYQPGNAAVGWDASGRSASALLTLMHELGHNFNLAHAPCGSPADADALYPYANALMGAGTRFIWGWEASTQRFIDATDNSRHDLMSYCSGDWLSDYNYANARNWLIRRAGAGINESASTQALLLISGSVDATGQVRLNPLRAFMGKPDSRPPRPTELMIELEHQGGLQRWPLDTQTPDHGTERHFSLAVPHPGALSALRVQRQDGRSLLSRQEASALPPRTLSARAQLNPADAALETRLDEAGRLQLSWDAQQWAKLSVTAISTTGTRQVLAQGLSDGKATLDIPAGSRWQGFELSLSQGLQARLMLLDAQGRATGANQ